MPTLEDIIAGIGLIGCIAGAWFIIAFIEALGVL